MRRRKRRRTEEEEDLGGGKKEKEEGEEGRRRRRKHLNVISVTVFVRLCPFMSVLIFVCFENIGYHKRTKTDIKPFLVFFWFFFF